MNKSVISFYTYFFRPSCAIIFLDYQEPGAHYPWAPEIIHFREHGLACVAATSPRKKSERDRDSSIFFRGEAAAT